jgi:hypothetical protein
MDHLETAISRDPSHNQLPNADTIAHIIKICCKYPGIAVSCETRPGPSKHKSGRSKSAIGWSTGDPNGGARESTQEAKGICNPIGGTTL